MRHPVRALLVAPLVVPIAFWVFSLGAELTRGVTMSPNLVLGELQVIALVGTPIAYGAALIWGVPVAFVLHRIGRLRAWTLIVAGAVGGAMAGWWVVANQSGDMFRVRMPFPVGAGLGALAGAVAWQLGRGRQASAAALNDRSPS